MTETVSVAVFCVGLDCDFGSSTRAPVLKCLSISIDTSSGYRSHWFSSEAKSGSKSQYGEVW